MERNRLDKVDVVTAFLQREGVSACSASNVENDCWRLRQMAVKKFEGPDVLDSASCRQPVLFSAPSVVTQHSWVECRNRLHGQLSLTGAPTDCFPLVGSTFTGYLSSRLLFAFVEVSARSAIPVFTANSTCLAEEQAWQ